MLTVLTNREIIPRRPNCLADEPVPSEPVSGRGSLLKGKMQGEFEKMQRGANCNRAKSCHFSITCIASPYSRSRETVIALAGTFREATADSRITYKIT